MYTWRRPESRSTKLVSMRRGNKHRILSWTIGLPGRVLRATSSPAKSTGEEFCDARMQTKARQGVAGVITYPGLTLISFSSLLRVKSLNSYIIF